MITSEKHTYGVKNIEVVSWGQSVDVKIGGLLFHSWKYKSICWRES